MTSTTVVHGRARGEVDRVERFAGLVWGFRLELALLALLGGVFVVLRRSAGLPAIAAVGVLAVVALALVAVSVVRRRLASALRAAWVRRRWRHAWAHCDLPAVHAGRVELVAAGERVSVRVSRGSSCDAIAERSEELAACLGLRELRVERDPADASRGTVTLVRRDPLAELGGVAWPQLDAGRLSLWEPIAVGLDEDGQTVIVSLVERNLLIGGEPGAGKSAALSILIASAALDADARLWLLDGKRVELAAWAPRAEQLVGPDVGEAIAVLERVQAVMEDRYRELLAGGLRKVERSAGMPLHVVVCDELAFYLTVEDRNQRTRFAELLRDVVARGRAAGVIVLAATQKPSADVVPSSLRDLFGFRLALRCTTPQASDTILGQGWASQGRNAATIPPADRGVGFLLAEDGLPVKLRTYYLTDAHVDELAERACGRRGRFSTGGGS
jgi:hypothetical protein